MDGLNVPSKALIHRGFRGLHFVSQYLTGVNKMSKYEISYTSWVTIEVEAETEDDALETADRLLDAMTGADFRECCDYEGIRELA